MKYTEHEQFQQILLRGRKLREKRDMHVLKGLSASATALLFVLVASVCICGHRGYVESKTVYGSFLLSAETGGYILVAVLAFVLGVVIAILLTKNKGAGKDTRVIRAEHRLMDERNKNGGNII